ncbi:MAG: LysR family transcriptional regulator [Porticoccaceae bacterium]|jgi:DNA-binding transcriptional LysR family regulator|nr:LysR family transcriptional regulator [Porticoccaceae bacterium]MBT5577584.1 LysR family transcriptional regulator [Porticoccaceae bacterium]MBT7375234.1 LysR family transcriptional regulator [Porticoccaceae bacterium]
MKNNKNIEIGALRIFAAVTEADTLTQAAERLGVTQSAVSQTIKQLETQTETQLVVTRSRPIKLTPSGQVLKDYAQQIINDTQRMLADVRMTAKGGLLPLNVGMVDSFCDVAGLQLMQQVKPFVSKLALRTGLGSSLSQDLLNRNLDLLITSDPIDEHPELQRHPILRDPFVMIVPEKYAQGGAVTPAWLAENIPFIRYTRQSRLGALTDLIARRLNIQLQTAYELDSTQTLLRFVQSGQGWAITTGLCMVRYPELLKGCRVMQLARGSNARHLTMLCRQNELGAVPDKVAGICRTIYSDEIVPQLIEIAPWLEQQAYSITEMPAI